MIRLWYKPYQKYTLEWILSHPDVDLNTGVSKKDGCVWCKYHLMDAMVNIHFGQGSLPKAQKALKKYDLIMDVTAMDRFPELAANWKLFPDHPSLSGRTAIQVKHEHPHDTGIPSHPNKNTKKLIAKFNQKDAFLYSYAQTLKTYVS